MSSPYLHRHFDESTAAFRQARVFWEGLVVRVLSEGAVPSTWRPMQQLPETPDGAQFMMGVDRYALMATIWSPEKMRGARITQFSSKLLLGGEKPWYSSWVEARDMLHFGRIDVLVINCVPTYELVELVQRSLRLFLIDEKAHDVVTLKTTEGPRRQG